MCQVEALHRFLIDKASFWINLTTLMISTVSIAMLVWVLFFKARS